MIVEYIMFIDMLAQYNMIDAYMPLVVRATVIATFAAIVWRF
jgi:hypothetical protein